MLLYSSKSVLVYVNEDKRLIVWQPLEHMPAIDWQESFEAALECYARYLGAGLNFNWLNDTRHIAAIGMENLNWLHGYLQSFMLSHPWPRIAFVTPYSEFGKIAVKAYLDQAKILYGHVPIREFEYAEDAEKWLVRGSSILYD